MMTIITQLFSKLPVSQFLPCQHQPRKLERQGAGRCRCAGHSALIHHLPVHSSGSSVHRGIQPVISCSSTRSHLHRYFLLLAPARHAVQLLLRIQLVETSCGRRAVTTTGYSTVVIVIGIRLWLWLWSSLSKYCDFHVMWLQKLKMPGMSWVFNSLVIT